MMGAWGGYHLKKCPAISTNTVHVYDTVLKEIPVVKNHYLIKFDTIVYEKNVPVLLTKADTLKILSDFYAQYFYTRNYSDSLLDVTQRDMVSQNKISAVSFKYKYKGATTIVNNSVDNSIHYNKYIYLGMSTLLKDPKYTFLNLTYAGPKWDIGVGYNPTYGFQVQAGIKLFNFKTTK